MGTTAASDEPTFSMALRFAPHVACVGEVSRFVGGVCRSFICDEDALSRLELAAYELMENVVKYTSSGDGEFQLRVLANASACRVLLQTQNRAAGEHRHDLAARMLRLTAAKDPLEHYDSEIAASARRPFGSGLGLVRILAEGEMIMGYSVEGESVVVRVEAVFSPEQRR